MQWRHREQWLEDYKPVLIPTSNRPFLLKWYKQTSYQDLTKSQQLAQGRGYPLSELLIPNGVFPIIRDLSLGLSIPKEVIEDNYYTLKHHSEIQQAMADLCEYVKSGRFRSKFLSDEDVLDCELAIIRIAKEEGLNEID